MALLGSYYKNRFSSYGLNFDSCENIVCFADFGDGATRDRDSAMYWLQGFGCPTVPIQLVDETTNADLQPVLSDHQNVGCPVATEEQVNGTYGGNIEALTDMYYDGIALVTQALEMPIDAPICRNVNPLFNPKTENCTLFETGYKWTGQYYQGMFLSPMYYASYFAEAWMFQYLSNLEVWAFNKLTFPQLRDIYNMHIESMWFGTNYW